MYFDHETLLRMLRLVHDPRTTTPIRTLVIDGLLPVYFGIHVANAVGDAVDAVRHPHLDALDPGAPIYIVAAPRSGTTFLHRLMSLDPGFAAFTLYQTIFPSVAASDFARLVRSGPGPFAHLAERIESQLDESFSGWAGVHDTGLGSDEEDEAIWAMALSTPAVMLLLPHPHEFQDRWYVDRLPARKRSALARTYRRALVARRAQSPDKTLLLKNVLLPGRYEIVRDAAPGARFVHILRHPYEVIPSALSVFTMPWQLVAREAYGPSEATRLFADGLIGYYRFFHDRAVESEARGDGRIVSVRYDALVASPLAELTRIYAELGRPLDERLRARFERALDRQRDFKSEHAYSLERFGLTKDYIADRLADVMEHHGFSR